MSPTLTTFLFESANFLVLAFVLGWLFFKPVRQALVDRRAAFEAESEEAANKLTVANRRQQEIEAAHANLQSELDELRSQELEAAKQQAEQILSAARTAAEREREMSRRQAARMSDTQRDRLAEVVSRRHGRDGGSFHRPNRWTGIAVRPDRIRLRTAWYLAARRNRTSHHRIRPAACDRTESTNQQRTWSCSERCRFPDHERFGGGHSDRHAERINRRLGQRTDAIRSAVTGR